MLAKKSHLVGMQTDRDMTLISIVIKTKRKQFHGLIEYRFFKSILYGK